MNTQITGTEIQDMVGHWLNTPCNAYFGSDYGQDLKSLLQRSQTDGRADEQIAKMRTDIPVLQILPSDSTNIYAVTSGVDRMDLIIEVAGSAFVVDGI